MLHKECNLKINSVNHVTGCKQTEKQRRNKTIHRGIVTKLLPWLQEADGCNTGICLRHTAHGISRKDSLSYSKALVFLYITRYHSTVITFCFYLIISMAIAPKVCATNIAMVMIELPGASECYSNTLIIYVSVLLCTSCLQLKKKKESREETFSRPRH